MSDSATRTSPATAAAPDIGAALPKPPRDVLPILLPLIVMAAAFPLVGSASSWVTLTLAGLALGMMIFTMASGLTLIFGLMDVLNFGHGAFVAIGAYVATLALAPITLWTGADSLGLNIAALAVAMGAAVLVSGALGLVFERVLIVPVYGQHLKQILVTVGGLIVAEQTLYALFGPQQIPLTMPVALQGSIIFGDIAIERYRLFTVVVGLIVLIGLSLTLNRTRIGLLIRAGVENREMVEALGYRIERLFIGVFMAGSALAGLGGVLWAFYRGQVHASMGANTMVLTLIVIIIGGLGSVGGCFLGAILIALVDNYAGFLAPKVALVSNIGVMVAVLAWRPRGLYPAAGR
jgi:branched-chain amino acid transport system permease protein